MKAPVPDCALARRGKIRALFFSPLFLYTMSTFTPLPAALHTSELRSLPLLARGKVRDNYAVGDDRILILRDRKSVV